MFDIDGAGSIGAYCKVNTVNAALTLLVQCNLIRGLVKVRQHNNYFPTGTIIKMTTD